MISNRIYFLTSYVDFSTMKGPRYYAAFISGHFSSKLHHSAKNGGNSIFHESDLGEKTIGMSFQQAIVIMVL